SVIDNAELTLIQDATVRLFEEGHLFSTITAADPDGMYRYHGDSPTTGKEYSVEVSHPKYHTVTSSDLLVNTGSASISKYMIMDSSTFYDPGNGKNYGEIDGNITLRIEDQADIDNYYLIKVFYMDSFFGVKSRYIIYDISSDNPAVDENYFNGLLISDFLFDGQSYEISFEIRDWDYHTDKEYIIVLESMSRARYLYEQSYSLYLNRLHNPFAEPVLVYNNIVNGYGIFAGFSTIERKITF
ncbi:MAG: DUF4249 family protein, partial [Bacteroidetes bacterium]|nr:DUF4249 family protein [Bacteroidota bacterium]